MTIKIGEALKELRLQAGLTQQEMCDNVISVSAYSKIERGVHHIDMETLISILSRNSIILSVEEFFKSLLVNSNQNKEDTDLYISLNLAFLARDVETLNKLKVKIESIPNNAELLENWNLISAFLNKENKNFPVDSKIKTKISNLRKIENQNIISLTQLQLLLPYLSIKESTFYLSNIWNKINKEYTTIAAIPIIFLEAYSKVIILFLEVLLARHEEKELFRKPLEKINTIVQSIDYPPVTSLGLKAKKIEALINEDEKTYRKIVKVEKLIGISEENISENFRDHPYYAEQ